ncbi:tRNA adenosine deaminase-associated protein [Nocardioides sp. R-C-SC26]|uniref:tRNA adenosine deaminase-associated protein n=1 Tax=Nocardioides sp. R-C-SC26 TaxID=2870414 RepID=UPI001E3E96BE|nr:tRNA adenosine deaminase-associated protein [Nocardioides sp. R-C-SC26]
MVEQLDAVDFALAAYREGTEWRLAELAHDVLDDVETLVHALRRFSADGVAVGMVGVDEDFFVLVRVDSAEVRMVLSDVTAAEEWELADTVLEHLGLPVLDEDDDEPAPAGDLELLADLGMSAPELADLLDEMLEDEEIYPDEALLEVAVRLGFGDLFEDAVGLTTA